MPARGVAVSHYILIACDGGHASCGSVYSNSGAASAKNAYLGGVNIPRLRCAAAVERLNLHTKLRRTHIRRSKRSAPKITITAQRHSSGCGRKLNVSLWRAYRAAIL